MESLKTQPTKSVQSAKDGKEINLGCQKLLCPSAISVILCIPLFPCMLCSCIVVSEKEEIVVLNFGKYIGTIKQPGIYMTNFCGRTTISTTTESLSMDLGDVKVVDSLGSPLMISGVSTYKIVNSRSATLNVNDPHNFVRTHALSTMKVVVSKKNYDELKVETEELNKDLIRSLQERVILAGVEILSFELTDLSYAPEIAKAMLVRQQAHAMVDARRTIVENAVMISRDAVKKLEESGVEFSREDRIRLLSNMLITITGEASPTPTISMG